MIKKKKNDELFSVGEAILFYKKKEGEKRDDLFVYM